MRIRATSEGFVSVAGTPLPADTERRSWLKRLGAALGLGLLAGPALAGTRGTQRTAGMDPYIGEIMLFAGNYAVQGYAICDGSLLSIAQNTALFSILGTTYGGNGTSNFALPDLRGRFPMGMGSGPGLTAHSLGQAGGAETTTLTTAQLPAHNHALNVSGAAGTASSPAGNVLASGTGLLTSSEAGVTTTGYATAGDGSVAAASSIGNTGGNQPHSNVNPYLALNFQMALQGVFPPRQ